MSALAQDIMVDTTRNEVMQAQTECFHLVIDALRLNGINTIYGVPGIPITDLSCMAQAEGIRVIPFRYKQNAGDATITAKKASKLNDELVANDPHSARGIIEMYQSRRRLDVGKPVLAVEGDNVLAPRAWR